MFFVFVFVSFLLLLSVVVVDVVVVVVVVVVVLVGLSAEMACMLIVEGGVFKDSVCDECFG